MMRTHSKHYRQRQDGPWLPGKVKIVANSSLRKLMRAARRGLLPDERLFTIQTAMQKAAERRVEVYIDIETRDGL
jgi:hypothetical protein